MRGFCFATVASLALFVSTSVVADSSDADPATWRWMVTAALHQQRADDQAAEAALAAADFRQHYERYTASGVLETGH